MHKEAGVRKTCKENILSQESQNKIWNQNLFSGTEWSSPKQLSRTVKTVSALFCPENKKPHKKINSDDSYFGQIYLPHVF